MTPPNHRNAVLLMLLATLLWSIAGVATRHLDSARGFEVTFWRSAFAALSLVLLLGWLRGPTALAQAIRGGGWPLWLSAACWCVMMTAFMLALNMTSVANVLVTSAIAPLAAALIARLVLRERLRRRTWMAAAVAGVGIAWMHAQGLSAGDRDQWRGVGVALLVPIGFAINWTLLQTIARRSRAGLAAPDMFAALLVGAILSCLVTLGPAQPFAASAHDLGLLATLGLVQVAIPCLIAVVASRTLSAPEASLLGLLEVLFGVAWAWLGAGEVPSTHTLGGGLLVLATLAAHEAVPMRLRK